MKNILIVFAHPAISESKIHKALLPGLADKEYITLHKIYDHYPDFLIDEEREMMLLDAHDIIVWQFPVFWFSGPALLKQWMDVVLRFNWAYGPKGNALKDKWVFNAISTGDAKETFCKGGENDCSIQDYIKPFSQSAKLCKMNYLPPFWVDNSYKISKEELSKSRLMYHTLLEGLANEQWTLEEIQKHTFLNQLTGGEK